MTIIECISGERRLDWTKDKPQGPFVTLTPEQWRALVREVRRAEGI